MPGWRNGRRKGLKILRGFLVPVRVRPSAPAYVYPGLLARQTTAGAAIFFNGITIMHTQLLYLERLDATTDTAVVVDILKENDKTVVILDKTVFYPQGGGQPYDTGVIENASGTFLVTEVRFVDGIVKHIGSFEQGSFSIGDVVHCKVNQERRDLHSRLHSAGHVIDMAVAQLNLDWVPGKGFHFPEGPYVEYAGNLDVLDKDALIKNIQELCRKIIIDNLQTTLAFMNKTEMERVCRFVSPFIPDNKPSRVVMYGSFGIPCGGTHVARSSDIQDILIRKIKNEKGAIRVSYYVPR